VDGAAAALLAQVLGLTTTAFTAAELLSQLQLVSRSCAIASLQQLLSTATTWSSSCTVAYRYTDAGDVAHLLCSQRSSSLSYAIVVSVAKFLQLVCPL